MKMSEVWIQVALGVVSAFTAILCYSNKLQLENVSQKIDNAVLHAQQDIARDYMSRTDVEASFVRKDDFQKQVGALIQADASIVAESRAGLAASNTQNQKTEDELAALKELLNQQKKR